MKSICFAILTLSFFVSIIYSVPPVINYAGQVAVDGEAFDGNGLFKFAIVNDSGSTTYWSNDGTSSAGSEPTSSVSVSVSGGLYSILLGNSAIQGMNAIDPTVFQQHADAKLRVWFNDGTNGFQQLTPDRSFASVPYAMASGASAIQDGSITRSKLESSILNDLQSSIADGSVSKAKMDPNLVRYFVPEISTNPAAVSIIQGTGTTLTVQADGKFLSYQWQKNGVDISGQNTSSLSLSNSSVGDDANYSVVISNDWGSVTSPLARVTVATALPTISILGSATLLHEAATSYTDSGATAVDALGGDLTSSISITSADINVTDVGNQVVTYSVTDAGGNANTATRTVTVQDTTDPILTLIGDSNFTHNLNTAWVDPGYDANDTLDGNLTASVSITGTVDVNSTGTYTLNYSVSDTAGNQVDINRTVNVAMNSWTFTNAGAVGSFGPTQAQIDDNYSETNLDGLVEITTQGLQEWVVPYSGYYRISALGARGGRGGGGLNYEGNGTLMEGDFYLDKNQSLTIVVGQSGTDHPNFEEIAGVDSSTGAGGGGSFVINEAEEPLLIAGGGNGTGDIAYHQRYDYGINAIIESESLGTGSYPGKSFSDFPELTGSLANYNRSGTSSGGFGGGGPNFDDGFQGGGGGGYIRGSQGYAATSYNVGSNQNNQIGLGSGQGRVIITYIGN